MMIIGIAGKARSGKDTFCTHLIDQFKVKYNRDFIKLGFADSLKNMCAKNFNLSVDQLWGNTKESPDNRFPKEDTLDFWTPREIMQQVGQFYRGISKDFWVTYLDLTCKDEGYTDIIIPDVRYLNEVDYIKSNLGVVFKINRDQVMDIADNTHESEHALDDFCGYDIEVDNNGSLEDLDYASSKIVEFIVCIEKYGRFYNGEENRTNY